MNRMPYVSQLHQLDRFLVETSDLWKPQPFRTERPDWCAKHPELAQALLTLDEPSLAHYAGNDEACMAFISGYLPQLAVIPSLISLPAAKQKQQFAVNPRLAAGVAGRKWQQITSLCQSIQNPQRPICEWCGGKGYLGRLISKQWQLPVTTLERNPQLIEAGVVLADKHQLQQVFIQLDVLKGPVTPYLNNHHAIALHACGDLHRELRQLAINNIPNLGILHFSVDTLW